jgi:hypothetical protein
MTMPVFDTFLAARSGAWKSASIPILIPGSPIFTAMALASEKWRKSFADEERIYGQPVTRAGRLARQHPVESFRSFTYPMRTRRAFS